MGQRPERLGRGVHLHVKRRPSGGDGFVTADCAAAVLSVCAELAVLDLRGARVGNAKTPGEPQ